MYMLLIVALDYGHLLYDFISIIIYFYYDLRSLSASNTSHDLSSTCGEWAIASHGRLRVLFSVLNNKDNSHVLVIVKTGF
jgi:hypothetical protein